MKKALVSFLIGGLLFVGLSVFGQSFPTWNLIGGALSPVNLTWKIGAGTTTPIYLLDVYGNARLGTSTASSLFFRGLSNFNDLFFIDASGNASTTGEWKGAKFTPEKLNYANATSDEQYLTYEASGNAFEWTTLPSGFTYDPPWITNGSILYSSSTFSNFAFGTTTPTGFLELYAATTTNTQLTITVATDTTTYDPRIVFRTGSNPTARFAVGVDYSDSNKFKIATSTLGVNDILTIDNIGRIGLGTTTPAQILAIQATGSIPALGVYASNSTPALFVNTNGDVGIGTVTPTSMLHVSGSSGFIQAQGSSSGARNGLRVLNDSNLNLDFAYYGSLVAGTLAGINKTSLAVIEMGDANRNLMTYLPAGTGNIYFAPNNAISMTIAGSSYPGNIGIGTTTPSSLLEIVSATNTAAQLTLTVATSTNTADPKIVFRTGNEVTRFAMGVDYSDSNKFKIATSTLGVNDILTIDNIGRTGLGTTTPAQILAVQATGSIPALGVYASNSSPSLLINTNGDVGIGTEINSSAKLQIVSLSSNDIGELVQTTNAGDVNFRWGSTGARYGELSWQTSPTLHATIKGTASRDLSLGAGDVNDYLWIDRTGNIGIGTTTPSSLLEIVSATNTAAQLTLTVATSTNTADPKIVFRTGNEVTRFALGVDYSDSNKFKIATTTLGTNDIFVVDQNGRVGFGTSSPANVSTFLVYGTSTFKGGSVKIGSAETANPLATLDVYASSSTKFWRTAILRRGIQGGDTELPTEFGFPYLQIGGIENRDNSIQSIGFGYVDSVATGNSSAIPPGEIGFQTTNTGGFTIGDLVFGTRSVNTETAALERMRITSSGKVGIGTSSPASILSIQGTSTTPALGVYASNSTPALFVNTNGDVGIGTVTPAAKLQIVSLSTADIGGLLQTTNEGDINLRWGSTAARYGQLSWQTSPTLHATIKGTASRDLSLGAGDVNDYLWIDRTGKIGVGTTSPLFAVDVEGNINIASGNTYKIGDADAVTAASTTAWNIAYDRASSSVMAFTVTDATSTPSSKNPLILKKFERAATIYKINCIADPLGTTGDQMTIDIWEADSTGQATSSVDATIACGTAGATDDGALTNPIIDASDWIYLHMKSASGSVESLGVSIYYY